MGIKFKQLITGKHDEPDTDQKMAMKIFYSKLLKEKASGEENGDMQKVKEILQFVIGEHVLDDHYNLKIEKTGKLLKLFNKIIQ